MDDRVVVKLETSIEGCIPVLALREVAVKREENVSI